MTPATYQQPAPVPAPLDRERVARIIEPNAWACLDALILNLTQGIAGDVNTLRRALRDGVTTEAELKAWWLTPNDLDTYAEKDCRRSLAKADAILALSQQGGLVTPSSFPRKLMS